jgi:enterochelin esterase-like enzyme
MHRPSLIALTVALFSTVAFAQPAPPTTTTPQRANRRPPQVTSPELSKDRHITFRILAPKADAVTLNAGDIQGNVPGGRNFTKGDNGIWELTVGPVDPGTYRYTFNVSGVPVVDPRNPAYSQSNNNLWSVIHVPGQAFEDEVDVPHGAVAAVHYFSKTLNKDRRMHVYTPPGYERGGDQQYPVLYLLHGSSDSDDSWITVGRANFILDNLIAAGKAKPMIVVMPHGHTSLLMGGPPPAAAAPATATGAPAARPAETVAEFDRDFLNEIKPYVESHYRILADRPNRAIAGLSMGGGQSLSISLPHLTDYAYVGVFSAAIFQRNLADWEQQHAAILDDAQAKDGLKLLWLRTGSTDGLLPRTKETVALLSRHGFKPDFQETTGGHVWINWRNYLNEFVPQLFK